MFRNGEGEICVSKWGGVKFVVWKLGEGDICVSKRGVKISLGCFRGFGASL